MTKKILLISLAIKLLLVLPASAQVNESKCNTCTAGYSIALNGDVQVSGSFTTGNTNGGTNPKAPLSVTQNATPSGSYQPVSVDFTLGATAGSSVSGNTHYYAPAMFNIFGDTLTKTQNYVGGMIGAFSVTGTNATTYPSGAVLGQITDGVTDADGAFVAYIDGDSAQTNARAAYAVMNNNSVPNSGFAIGLNLGGGATHDGYPAVSYTTGDVQFSGGALLLSGSCATRACVLAAYPSAPQGSIYVSSAAGGHNYIKVANAAANTDWQLITSSAAD